MTTGFIDWTENNLNLYIFEKDGSGYKLAESLSFDIKDGLNPEYLAPLIRTEIKNICLSVPFNILTVRELAFPFSGKNKISETIPYELEGVLLGDTSDYVIDHIETGQTESGSTVLAVCLEKTRLHEIIDTFSPLGFDPRTITSVDLRLSGGDIEKLFSAAPDTASRAEAAAEEIRDPSINLRQEELAYTGDIERLNKSLRFTALLILILLAVIGTGTSMKLISLNKEHRSLSTEMQKIYSSVFPEEKKIVDAKRQFAGKINALKKKNAVLSGIPALDILYDIASGKNIKGITLHEFTAEGKNIIIKGTAGSFEDVESLKNALSNAFRNAKVTDSGATADKKIGFTIIMQEKTA